MTEDREPRQLGDFQLLEKIGQGGMGEVYRAHQVSLDRMVAIKLLPESFAKKTQFLERFKREARAAANLLHPNVLQVYAYGVEDDKAYIAMEYVEGEDLSDRLKKGSIPLDESVRIIADAAKALAAAGDKGIVHRDIKPANIMLNSQGEVKVMDFGLAKVAEGDESELTEAGLVVGTPKYISPEQGKGEKLDPRSDIYSLGVTFFQLLTGRVPFTADNSTSLIYKHVFEAPPSPRSLNPEVPPFIEDVCLRMLAKKPDERYPNGHEVVRDLEEFQQHKDDYIASGRRRVAPTVEEEEAPAVIVAPGRASPATLGLAAVALLLAMISLGVSLRAIGQSRKPSVVIGEEAPTTPSVDFIWEVPLPPGTEIRWNGVPDRFDLVPLQKYDVREGRVTIVLDRPGYMGIFVDVEIRADGAFLRDGSKLGTLDLRPLNEPTKKLRQAYQQGRDFLEAKKYDDAVRHLMEATGLDPEYRISPKQDSAQELLERAKKGQEKQWSLRHEYHDSLRIASALYAKHQHRPALSKLKSLLARLRAELTLPLHASFDRAKIVQLQASYQRDIDTAGAELSKIPSLVLSGELDESRRLLASARRLDPEHEEVSRLEARVNGASRARARALAHSSDPKAAIKQVIEYLQRFGKHDTRMLARLEELEVAARELKQKGRSLRAARASMKLAAARGAWREVHTTARQVLDELDSRDTEARRLLARASRELKLAGIRSTIARLDRVCEQLDLRGDEVVGLSAALALVPREDASALRARLASFLAIGRILTSERRNIEITLLKDGTALVRFEWQVQLELRKLSQIVQITLAGQATARPSSSGWVLSQFHSQQEAGEPSRGQEAGEPSRGQEAGEPSRGR